MKNAFVIAPLGQPGSDVRLRSDQVLKYVVRPALVTCGYRVTRADEISEPGIVTSQVVAHLLDDELVVADLTGRNPNVFYELGIRHWVRKPTIHLIARGETIPFDVAHTRFVMLDHQDLDSVAAAKKEIVRSIRAAEAEGATIETPVTIVQALRDARRHQPVPLRAYIADDDPTKAARLAKAVELFSEALGLVITDDSPPKRGSWLKNWLARTSDLVSLPEVAERLHKAEQVVEQQAIRPAEPVLDQTHSQAAAALLRALESEEQAVVQIGSLLILKYTDSDGEAHMVVRTLTTAELMTIEREPSVLSRPFEILSRLDLARKGALVGERSPDEAG